MKNHNKLDKASLIDQLVEVLKQSTINGSIHWKVAADNSEMPQSANEIFEVDALGGTLALYQTQDEQTDTISLKLYRKDIDPEGILLHAECARYDTYSDGRELYDIVSAYISTEMDDDANAFMYDIEKFIARQKLRNQLLAIMAGKDKPGVNIQRLFQRCDADVVARLFIESVMKTSVPPKNPDAEYRRLSCIAVSSIDLLRTVKPNSQVDDVISTNATEYSELNLENRSFADIAAMSTTLPESAMHGFVDCWHCDIETARRADVFMAVCNESCASILLMMLNNA